MDIKKSFFLLGKPLFEKIEELLLLNAQHAEQLCTEGGMMSNCACGGTCAGECLNSSTSGSCCCSGGCTCSDGGYMTIG